MSGFQLRSDFDHHLKTFLVMVQCKRKVNTSRQVTATDLVDLQRATELFREVVPLLRAELDELKRELLGSVSKRKKKVVTFADDWQTNPFLEQPGVQQSEVEANQVNPAETEVALRQTSTEVQQPGVPSKTENPAPEAKQEKTSNSAVKTIPNGPQTRASDKLPKKPTPINWGELKTFKVRTGLPPCYLCGGQHALYSCNKFRSWPLAERLQYIQRNRLCVNCFSQKHSVTSCREVPRCKICAGLHSTLLHRTP